MQSVPDIVTDFDAIASALERGPPRETLTSAERALLRHVPAGARSAVDVGCGDGVVSRALARRGLDVLGIDVSPRMVALARARSPAALRVQYRVADIMAAALPARAFDVVVSINVVHHVPLHRVIPRLAAAVAPGGRLLIQDVVRRPRARDVVVNAAAGLRVLARRVRGRSPVAPAVRALYDKHGDGEAYLTPAEIAEAYAPLLPGARIEHHLEWRSSVVWERPAAP